MKIRIKEDAKNIYLSNVSKYQLNWEWADLLENIQGQILEVETDYLFKDQYNTVPIPNISETGLRIMEESVAEVIDDERLGKARCCYCGKVSCNTTVCEHCGSDKYLEIF